MLHPPPGTSRLACRSRDFDEGGRRSVDAVEDRTCRCPFERERVEVGEVVGVHRRPAVPSVADVARHAVLRSRADHHHRGAAPVAVDPTRPDHDRVDPVACRVEDLPFEGFAEADEFERRQRTVLGRGCVAGRSVDQAATRIDEPLGRSAEPADDRAPPSRRKLPCLRARRCGMDDRITASPASPQVEVPSFCKGWVLPLPPEWRGGQDAGEPRQASTACPPKKVDIGRSKMK